GSAIKERQMRESAFKPIEKNADSPKRSWRISAGCGDETDSRGLLPCQLQDIPKERQTSARWQQAADGDDVPLVFARDRHLAKIFASMARTAVRRSARLLFFHFVPEKTFDLAHLGADDRLAILFVRVIVEIIDVIIFGRIKLLERRNLSHDLVRKDFL